MAQERNERLLAHAAAIRSLKNELELAVRLLRTIKEARDTVAVEDHALDAARGAFRHGVNAMERLPKLTSNDMSHVQRLMDEFRTALSDLGA